MSDQIIAARIDVQVMPIEPEYCHWCGLYDDAEVPVTHAITVTPWFGPWGANANWRACQQHARMIEKAVRAQIVPYKLTAAPASGAARDPVGPTGEGAA